MIFILAGIVLVCAGFAVFFYFRVVHYKSDAARKSDIESINNTDSDVMVLSMFPDDNISAEKIEFFRGVSAIKAEHTFGNLYDICDFLEAVKVPADSIFLALDPVSISSDFGFHASLYGRVYNSTLLSEIRSNPDTEYKILLSYYSLDYWKALSDSEIEKSLSAYRDFVNIFYGEPNVTIYFFGAEEWLIANPGNYENILTCNQSVTDNIIALILKNDEYVLSPENMEAHFELIGNMAQNTSSESLLSEYDMSVTIDLSDMDIIFFGDSVIGNFTDSSSIPGVVSGLSKAHVYNLGLGGTTATYNTAEGSFDLVKIIDAFLDGDTTAFSDEQQPKYGIEEYFSEHSDGTRRNTCFIINYGLNDYFAGMPVDIPYAENESTCYRGAFITACEKLRSAFPDCRIILMTPTFCSYYKNGTLPQSESGGSLSDYADAVKAVAAELDVDYMDNYSDLGINKDNYPSYLSDGCHPNEKGRYVIGIKILEVFRCTSENPEP
jgi:lysophospholipase L1-like esterase